MKRPLPSLFGLLFCVMLTSSVQAQMKVVAMGASTGGQTTYQQIIGDLYGNPVDRYEIPPIVIVQHALTSFSTDGFIGLMNSKTHVVFQWLDPVVRLAKDGEELKNGYIYVAPSVGHPDFNKHTTVVKENGKYFIKLDSSAKRAGGNGQLYRPSVDVLFESVGASAGADGIGFELTGQGYDGACGLWDIRSAGGQTWAQSPNDPIGQFAASMPIWAVTVASAQATVDAADVASKIPGGPGSEQ